MVQVKHIVQQPREIEQEVRSQYRDVAVGNDQFQLLRTPNLVPNRLNYTKYIRIISKNPNKMQSKFWCFFMLKCIHKTIETTLLICQSVYTICKTNHHCAIYFSFKVLLFLTWIYKRQVSRKLASCSFMSRKMQNSGSL